MNVPTEPNVPTDSFVRAVAAAPAMAVQDGGVRLGRGEVVDDLFEVRRTLGAGGMGAVYEAYDRSLDRTVALKLHRSVGSEGVLRRMRSEARAMARVVHPNVLTVHAVGLHRGSLYIAMEYAPGGTLRRWLREARSPEAIVDVFVQAGRGLAAAHAAGILHRDFKPDNVLVDERGVAKVGDFGLANELSAVAPSQSEVGQGDHGAGTTMQSLLHAGTPAYMPPEQLRGEPLSGRADQYAFCVALYEALYGTLPFRVEPLATLAERIADGPAGTPADAEVGRALREVLLRGLSSRADDRYPDMGALVDAVAQAADAPRRRRARWRLGVAVSALAVATGVAGSLAAVMGGDGGVPSDPCAHAGAAIDPLWNDEREATLRTAFGDEGLGAQTWARARDVVADWTASWRDARVQVCSAGAVEGATARALAGEACLESSRRELAVLLERLDRADDEARRDALEWVHGLSAPADCLDVDRLAALDPRPTDLSVRDSLETIEDSMRRLRRDLEDEVKGSPIEVARGLVARAEAIGYDPTTAWAERVLASALEQEGDIEGARAANRRGFDRAVAGGDWREALLHATEIAGRYGRFETEDDQAEEWLATAQALVPRARDVALEAYLRSTAALVAAGRGDIDAAVVGFREAADLLRASNPEHPRLPKFLANAGMAALEAGDMESGRALLEEALETAIRLLGPSHPYVGRVHLQIGSLELRQSHVAAAQVQFEKALALTQGHAVEPVVEYQLLQHLSATASRLGKRDEAEDYARRCYERVLDVYPPTHPRVFLAKVAWAQIVGDNGDPQRGATLVREALAGRAEDDPAAAQPYVVLSYFETDLGEHDAAVADATRAIALNADDSYLARCHYARAHAYLGAGEAARARADFEHGFAVQPEAESRSAYHAARKDYATLLVDVPGRRAEAISIAREARTYFSAEDTRSNADVDELDAWLVSVGAAGDG